MDLKNSDFLKEQVCRHVIAFARNIIANNGNSIDAILSGWFNNSNGSHQLRFTRKDGLIYYEYNRNEEFFYSHFDECVLSDLTGCAGNDDLETIKHPGYNFDDLPQRIQVYLLDWKNENSDKYTERYGKALTTDLEFTQLLAWFQFAMNYDLEAMIKKHNK